MKKPSQLNKIARQNGCGLTFKKDGDLWIASDFKGKQIWCGTYFEMVKIAHGKDL